MPSYVHTVILRSVLIYPYSLNPIYDFLSICMVLFIREYANICELYKHIRSEQQ